MYTYATSPADVVADQDTGRPVAGVRLTVWTAKDGMQITAGLRDLAGNPLPGYLETDDDGRFPFTDDAERPNALWALTPGGDWFSLVANELRDDVGQIIGEFPQVRQDAADAVEAVDEFRPEVAAATTRSVEALRVAEQANQTASIVIEPEWPLIIAHRGGALVWPEESREAMEDAARAGFPLEVDVRPLADGTLVCCHDDNVDRTMIDIGTGPVAEKTLAQWRQAKIKSPVIGGTTGTPMTFDEWLDGYGGSSLLVPELKPGATDEEVDRLVVAVKTRRLENSLIAQSFDLAVCVKMQEAGLKALYLVGATTPVDVEEVVAAGVTLMSTNKNRPVADVEEWQAAGLKVIAYTVKTRNEQVEKLTTFDGVFSDDPWATSNRVPVLSGDPFRGGHKPYGMQMMHADTVADVPFFLNGSALMVGNSVGSVNGTHYISQPWAGDLGVMLQVELDVMFEQASQNQDRNLGFWLIDTPGEWPVDGALPGQQGFTCLLRRSGKLDMYTFTSGGAAVLAASVTASAPIAEANQQGRATVIFRWAGNGGAYLRMITDSGVYSTPTVQTGLAIASGARLWLRATGTSGKFLDVRISNPYL